MALLVDALKRSGLDPWWDKGLHVGENWRSAIETHLEEAGCVIVVWTAASTGMAGDFVRDEAGRAKARGVLVPVIMERGVRPPLGFGEVQAIDLTHWRGNLRDTLFLDLLGAVRARLEGVPLPSPRGPTVRLTGRLAVGGCATALLASIVGFAMNLLGVQGAVCAAPFGQPQISDMCGALRLGGKPTREERIAFDALPPGDCTALLSFRARFEQSPLRELADSRLTARTVEQMEQWTESTRRLALYASGANASQARSTAQTRAAQLCTGFASTGLFRLVRAEATGEFGCEAEACGIGGEAVCHLLEKQLSVVEKCP